MSAMGPMNIDAVGYLAPQTEIVSDVTSKDEATGEFAPWLTRELTQVNQQLINADTQLQRLATGEVENLHQVMISLEKAKLSFELILQVRNRLLEAYQDILRMQI